MFQYDRIVRMGDTDATGCIYFSKAFDMAMETLEIFLQRRSFFIAKKSFLFPVVHAEGDFSIPVSLGDQLRISLEVKKVGASSISLSYLFWKQEVCMRVLIVHVAVDRETKEKIMLPDELRKIFEYNDT